MAFLDELRQFIEESELSQDKIAKTTRIGQRTLSQFLAVQLDLNGKEIEDICEVLGLKLVKILGMNAQKVGIADRKKYVAGMADIRVADKPAPGISSHPGKVGSLEPFFSWLFGDRVGPDHLLCLLTSMDNVTYFPSLLAAIQYLSRTESDQKVFFKIGLYNGKPPSRLPQPDDVGLVPGLWCNIELACSSQEGEKEKPDFDTAVKLLMSIDLEPSILIHVGNCLQAYWLFSEPWLIKPGETQRQYESYRELFSATMCTAFYNTGYIQEPVGDINGHLQIPGTINRQVSDTASKMLILLPPHGQAPVRYTREDFEKIFVHVDWCVPIHGSIPRNNPILDLYHVCPDANPSLEKLNALLNSDTRFAALWTHQVNSVPDQSLSNSDDAIAYELLKLGWSDQEIVNALIANRRLMTPGSLGKYMRRDYFQKTLGNAKKMILREQAYIDMVTFFKMTRLPSPLDKEKMVACLSHILNLPLVAIRQTHEDHPQYTLLLKNEKKIRIGYLEDFYYQEDFKKRIENAVPKIWETIPNREWTLVTHIIIKATGPEDDKNGGLASQVIDSLDRFLELHPPAESGWKSAAVSGSPFIWNGHLFLSSSFKAWFKNNIHDVILEQDFDTILRDMGFVGKRKAIRGPDGTFNRYYHIISWKEAKILLSKGLGRSVSDVCETSSLFKV